MGGESSILDPRLAEIDRRLRTIQTGLEPAGADPPSPGDRAQAEAKSLISQMRALTDAYERVLGRAQTQVPEPRIAVAAGPFTDTGAVRSFERALAALPQVAEVTVREYLSEDRVLVDVTLAVDRSSAAHSS